MNTLYNGMTIDLDTPLIHQKQRRPNHAYQQVSVRRYLQNEHCLQPWQVQNNARYHPQNVMYPAPAAVRAIAHAVEQPGSIISGFSALALYGLPYLVEGADTTLVTTSGHTSVAGACRPTIRRSRISLATWTVTHRGVPLQAVTPLTAVIQALVQVKRGEHRWSTITVEGLAPEEVRGIQLVDCVRRFWDITPSSIAKAARHKIDATWLHKVLRHSSVLADSPKETEMRLLVAALANRYGCTVEEQVPLRVGDQLVTVFDLAIPELKIAVMYDGAHHSDYQQRNKDSSITLKMIRQGWTPARCSAATMFECLTLIEELMQEGRVRVQARKVPNGF
ncbi:hypothetical protein [Corynebacterium sp. UMB2355A]|uniref:hypothetical protein n=1 Tax=Corynebacterium sp. UMB2355A TaxID=3081222 RepID=UPI0029FF3384|nr:hypothetical protein [Corynebacterium sp. UMB2355A]WPJ91858.1 hypothetical protein R0V12_05975 [Corynebacterium sp. UMB2355A]